MGLSSNQTSNSGNSNEFLPPNSSPTKNTQQNSQESKKLKCPRCESTNTKFCYYNNYNKSQPRHFCKSCRRYWTAGGTLRNVPVGGGRKNKRPKPPIAATKGPATSYQFMNRVTQMDFQAHNPNKGSKQAISTHDDHELHFPSSSFPCSISASSYVSEFGALEETAMAGVEPCLSLSSLDDQPWTYMESINSNWVWDDIDKFVCSDDVSIPWNDAEIN